MNVNLVEKFVEKLKPGKQRQQFRDAAVTGFGLRIEPNGRKSFFWNAKVRRDIVHRALGEWPGVSVQQARAAAKELAGKAEAWKREGGPSPFLKEKPAPKPLDAPTFEKLVNSYIDDHLWSPTAQINNPAHAAEQLRWMVNRYFEPWKNRPVDSIAQKDVLALRDSAAPRKYMANRLVQTARLLFAWCSNDEDGRTPVWPLEKNPAENVSLHPETPRDRYLTGEELARLEDGLEDAKTPENLRDFVRLAIDTGQRKENILSMEWTEIDWERATWSIPAGKTKNRKPYTVDLLPRSIEILERRAKNRTTSPYVFPAVSAERGFIHLDKPWSRLLKRLGLKDLRIHDLRRTCASGLASAGVPAQQIAVALGHSDTNMRAVLRYAKLFPENLPVARKAGAAKLQEHADAARKRMKNQQTIVMEDRKGRIAGGGK